MSEATAEKKTEKVFNAEEVSKHNDRDDLWMVINGKVYDVTGFVDEHPGGEEVLVDVGGKDATSEFEDVGHSEDAEEILTGLLVGKADETVSVTNWNIDLVFRVFDLDNAQTLFIL